MIVSFPYIIVVFIYFILFYVSKISTIESLKSDAICLFIFFIFFAFRGYIFTDVFNYKKVYDAIPDLLTVILKHKRMTITFWEPGFLYYCSFLKIFLHDYYSFQVINSLIDLILLISSVKFFSVNKPILFFFILFMGGITLFVDAQRNIKAVLIFIYSIRFILNKKFIYYYLFCFIAILFHVSAILYLPLYFILNIKFNRFAVIIIFIISLLSFFINNPLVVLLNVLLSKMPGRIGALSSVYFPSDGFTGRRLSFGVLEKFATFIFVYTLYKRIYYAKYVPIINCFFVYFLSYFLFSFNVSLSERISHLFIFSYWFLFPELLLLMKPKKRFLLLIIFLFYGFLKVSLYNQPHQRYENFLFNSMSFEKRLRWNHENGSAFF